MIYPAKVELLDDVLGCIEEKLNDNQVPLAVTMSFLVAVEEIFVNVASYAYPNKDDGEVEIDFKIENGQAFISFKDSGIAFNPLDKPDPDVNASAEERDIGGLGIYMVKKSMDGVEYNREDDKNILSFWKNY